MKKDELELTTDAVEPKIAKVSEITEKANEIKQKRELPPKPGSKVSFQQMNDWLRLLTPEMVEGNRIVIYVYRVDPVIIRQLTDPKNPNNVDVILQVLGGVDENYFIERHGGGQYKLVVKDVDNPKDSRGFFESSLTIPMQEYFPMLDLKEVDWNNPKNRGFRQWCLGLRKIDENNMPVIQGKDGKEANANSGDSMVNAMKLMLEFASKMSDKEQERVKKELNVPQDSLSKSLGDILLEKMKQEDPNKQLTTVTTLIAAMKGMQSEKKSNDGQMFASMMSMMLESFKQQSMMMMEMIKQINNKPQESSKISELKDLVEVAKELGGGSGEKKSTTEAIIDGISQVVGPALNLAAQFMSAKSGTNVNTGFGKPSTVTTAPTETQPTMEQPQPQISANEAQQIIAQFGGVIMNHLQAEGWEFGAWLVQGFGDPVATKVTRLGVDNLLSAAKSVPEFWSQVESTYGEAHLRKWLTSFVNYREEMAKMDMEEGNENPVQ